MRRAVVHVNLDSTGGLSLPEWERAIAVLRDREAEIVAADLAKVPRGRREVELIRPGDHRPQLEAETLALCRSALAEAGLAGEPEVGAISFLSRGSEEDARGVIRSFGLDRDLLGIQFGEDDSAVFEFAPGALTRSGLGKLHTLLEAALNRSVRFIERASATPAQASTK